MTDYIKENGTIYETRIVKKEIDLEALKDRLARLKAIEKPTDKELIEVGKEFHDYYEGREGKITLLEAQIAEIEAVK